MNRKAVVMVLALLTAAQAVAAAAEKREEKEFTLGLVQQQLRAGLSQTDLVAAVGSPNLVTRSSDGREAWIYDKVASETTHDGWRIGGFGFGAATAGAATFLGVPTGSREKSKTITSQRTLTVVVKFTAAGVVESFTYHASRF